jgi:deoxyribonuclease I
MEVFEVRPLRRGDIARAIFYFAVRYQQTVAPEQEAALRSWHDADPPDATEQARNDAIAGLQKNRNPFIDRPDFVARITDY